jgi:hypothetical protein
MIHYPNVLDSLLPMVAGALLLLMQTTGCP